MVLSGLCYSLLALTGALGLGFGTLLGALHASWPAHPWAAPVLAGPLAGVVGEVAARRRSPYSASAALLVFIALGFALRPAGPGWGAVLLAVAWGAAGAGLPALFPLAAAMAGPEGAWPARVAVGALGHLGTGILLLVATTGAGPTLWVGLAVAAAAGGLVMLCVRE
ncbi:MAG: hypothetical protein HYT86_00485 [candidate division NC10 bacterium]|nr:hypothetical protein [candidate division NC10 bacterium]